MAFLAGCQLQQERTGGVAQPQIVAKGLPADLTSLSIGVSGPGMSDLVRTLTPDSTSLVLEIPAGVDRRFEISGYVGALGSVPAYVGDATVDLKPGEQQTVSNSMRLAAGKIYVPNFGSDSLTVIDGATNTVIATLTVGTQPGYPGILP